MKVSCAFTVVSLVAAVASTSQPSAAPQSYQFAPKSVGVPSSETLKSAPTLSPNPVQPSAYPAPISYQYLSEYNTPYSRSAIGPKATAAAPSPISAYQPAYQPQQQYNYGPYQQYYPASAYPAASGYYPTPYSAYPFAAQPYSNGPYSSYPSAYPSYYNQFSAPSALPYSGQFASPTASPYSSLPTYQHQQLRSSAYNSAVDGNQYPSHQLPSQQYSSQQFPSQQYPSFYQNSPAVTTASGASESSKVSSENK